MSLDKGEILDDMHEGNSPLKSFMACVEDNIREKEAVELGNGLDLYRRFVGKREFKRYLHGRSDEGARLLFKFKCDIPDIPSGPPRISVETKVQ